jgi:hypothetical protein
MCLTPTLPVPHSHEAADQTPPSSFPADQHQAINLGFVFGRLTLSDIVKVRAATDWPTGCPILTSEFLHQVNHCHPHTGEN